MLYNIQWKQTNAMPWLVWSPTHNLQWLKFVGFSQGFTTSEKRQMTFLWLVKSIPCRIQSTTIMFKIELFQKHYPESNSLSANLFTPVFSSLKVWGSVHCDRQVKAGFLTQTSLGSISCGMGWVCRCSEASYILPFWRNNTSLSTLT